MALGGRATFTIDAREVQRKLENTMRHVGTGTKKATIAICEEILDESLGEVPAETYTLASSAFFDVTHNDTGSGFMGVVGYGGNGDPVNPKSGQRASEYMIIVHEDLQAIHPLGKAKFLEDPVKRVQRRLNPRWAHFLRQYTGM